MLAFRSEEHRDNWLSARALRHGATLTLEQQWDLARIWYRGSRGAGSAGPHNRLSPGWRRRSPVEAQAVFESVGLMGPFWKLPG